MNDKQPDESELAHTYDAAGRITKVQREDGNVIYYGYDNADRLTSEDWYDSGMSQLYAFAWDYDSVGNRTYQSRDGAETYYDYNAANELTHSVTGGNQSYYSYDSRGNCLTIQEPDGTTYFDYNHANLVKSIVFKDGTPNYFYYDARLRRYGIEDSDGLRYFAWDQNRMNLLGERDTGGNTTAEYSHGHTPIGGIGSLVSAKKVESAATYYQYPIYDHRGSVVRLLDARGSVTAYYEYSAWGEVLHEQETGAWNHFRYQSNWICLKDSSGALFLSPTRLYYADTGRFLTRDPLNNVLWENVYVYASCKPSFSIDASGLWTEVRREGKARAETCAEENFDEIYDLAYKVRLNGSEAFGRNGWLLADDGRQVWGSRGIEKGRVYSVPNTGYIDVSTFGALFLGLQSLGYRNSVRDRWESEGLNVLYTFRASKQTILQHPADRHIWKFLYIGHAAAGCLTRLSDADKNANGIIVAARYTQYGISEMQLIGCETNEGAWRWKRNVSALGRLRTVKGTLGVFSGEYVDEPGE